MRSRARRFVVLVAVQGRAVSRSVMAETLPLAVGMAESIDPKGIAVHVTQEVDVLGRCCKCDAVIEGGEYHHASRDRLKCSDCL